MIEYDVVLKAKGKVIFCIVILNNINSLDDNTLLLHYKHCYSDCLWEEEKVY